MSPAISQRVLNLVAKYPTQAEAAGSWDVDPSIVSRMVTGRRASMKILQKIAAKEGLPVGELMRTEVSAPLQLSSPAVQSPKFEFSISDPARMAEALLDYFSELPASARIRITRTIMRALADEAFNELNPAPEAWRFTMRRLDTGGI